MEEKFLTDIDSRLLKEQLKSLDGIILKVDYVKSVLESVAKNVHQDEEKLIKSIDFDKLRNESVNLYLAVDRATEVKDADDLEGLIGALDTIKDIAVDKFHKPEEHVFIILRDKNDQLLEIGQSVDVDSPEEDDMHNFDFTGTVVGYRKGNVLVEDIDENTFELEPYKVEIVEVG